MSKIRKNSIESLDNQELINTTIIKIEEPLDTSIRENMPHMNSALSSPHPMTDATPGG